MNNKTQNQEDKKVKEVTSRLETGKMEGKKTKKGSLNDRNTEKRDLYWERRDKWREDSRDRDD